MRADIKFKLFMRDIDIAGDISGNLVSGGGVRQKTSIMTGDTDRICLVFSVVCSLVLLQVTGS